VSEFSASGAMPTSYSPIRSCISFGSVKAEEGRRRHPRMEIIRRDGVEVLVRTGGDDQPERLHQWAIEQMLARRLDDPASSVFGSWERMRARSV